MGTLLTSSIARPASTVILLRPSAERFHAFLVRRHDDVAFMGGAHVFPGGRVDPVDRLDDPTGIAGGIQLERIPGVELRDAVAYYRAAARELSEEAGVTLAPSALTPFARWITPEIEIKRFDTVFFVAVAPADQHAAHGGGETTEGVWLDPADAIAQCRAGAIALPPPTWTTLRTLERFSKIEDVLAWARTRRIVPVQPRLMDRQGIKLLTLPGDPQYPAVDGFETPAETRFLLENRRWKPVNPDVRGGPLWPANKR